MKRVTNKHQKAELLARSRWAAYATASAATALCAASAEGHIHYSGKINSAFGGDTSSIFGKTVRTFPLAPGANIRFSFSGTSQGYYDYARFAVLGPGGGFRGRPKNPIFFWTAGYVEKVHLGEVMSDGRFVPGQGYLAKAVYYRGVQSQWTQRGEGFVGFKFNVGAGDQYGWARVRCTGEKWNFFIVVDYAWGDPGDAIVAGQRRDTAAAAPNSGSLGHLAVGATGLEAWRQAKGVVSQ